MPISKHTRKGVVRKHCHHSKSKATKGLNHVRIVIKGGRNG